MTAQAEYERGTSSIVLSSDQLEIVQSAYEKLVEDYDIGNFAVRIGGESYDLFCNSPWRKGQAKMTPIYQQKTLKFLFLQRE